MYSIKNYYWSINEQFINDQIVPDYFLTRFLINHVICVQ